jgi:uncharacterized protein YegP (UPF0339 family)
MTRPAFIYLGRRHRFFRDAHGDWRWHLVARNGRIIACSGEGYRRWRDCVRAAGMLTPAPSLTARQRDLFCGA